MVVVVAGAVAAAAVVVAVAAAIRRSAADSMFHLLVASEAGEGDELEGTNLTLVSRGSGRGRGGSSRSSRLVAGDCRVSVNFGTMGLQHFCRGKVFRTKNASMEVSGKGVWN